MNDSGNLPVPQRRRLWPWVVAAFVVVGVLLAAIAIRREAQRIREQRQFQMPN